MKLNVIQDRSQEGIRNLFFTPEMDSNSCSCAYYHNALAQPLTMADIPTHVDFYKKQTTSTVKIVGIWRNSFSNAPCHILSIVT